MMDSTVHTPTNSLLESHYYEYYSSSGNYKLLVYFKSCTFTIQRKKIGHWRYFNPNLIVFSHQVLCSILDSNTKGTVDRTSLSLFYLLNFLLDF